jgi:hypothetical protein
MKNKKELYTNDFFGSLSDWKRPTEQIKEEMKKGWQRTSFTSTKSEFLRK